MDWDEFQQAIVKSVANHPLLLNLTLEYFGSFFLEESADGEALAEQVEARSFSPFFLSLFSSEVGCLSKVANGSVIRSRHHVKKRTYGDPSGLTFTTACETERINLKAR